MQPYGNVGDLVSGTLRRMQEKDKEYVYSGVYDDPLNVSWFRSLGYEIVSGKAAEAVDGVSRIGDVVVMRCPEKQWNAVQEEMVRKDNELRATYRRKAASIAEGRDVPGGIFFGEREEEPKPYLEVRNLSKNR